MPAKKISLRVRLPHSILYENCVDRVSISTMNDNKKMTSDFTFQVSFQFFVWYNNNNTVRWEDATRGIAKAIKTIIVVSVLAIFDCWRNVRAKKQLIVEPLGPLSYIKK